MPRINPVYNFAKSSCVSGLAPLPAQKSCNAQRVHIKAAPRQGYSKPPNNSVGRHTANVMRNGKYAGKLSISQAEKKLIEELGRM